MLDMSDGEIEGFIRAHGPFEEPPTLAMGDMVGEWKVLAFLGRGGSAEVYRAENGTTGQIAALKVLFRSDERTRERFKRETGLVAEARSPAFPKFYGAGCAGGRLYMAEELLEPMALPKGDAAVARFVLEVAAGVEVLHKHGFVHRDIKPGNVMMRPATGESVLIDMGLAKEIEETPRTRNNTLSVVEGRAVGVGTPGFSAPEQFSGGGISAATDIHALGILANVCFNGRPPKAWIAIIRRSTSSIPEQRYATIAEFARAVRRRHAILWWVMGIAATLAIVLVAVFCLWPRKSGPVKPITPDEQVSQEPRPTVKPETEVETVVRPAVKPEPEIKQEIKPAAKPKFKSRKPAARGKGKPGNKQAGQNARTDEAELQNAMGEALLEATYELYYSNVTNIDKKKAMELMRKGISPVF